MKKLFSLIIVCLLFNGCTSSPERLTVSKAEVLEILEDRILVKPFDTLNDEPIYFLISSFTLLDHNIKVGDYITATIDTKLMMSYPGQVNAFEIRIIKGEK